MSGDIVSGLIIIPTWNFRKKSEITIQNKDDQNSNNHIYTLYQTLDCKLYNLGGICLQDNNHKTAFSSIPIFLSKLVII